MRPATVLASANGSEFGASYGYGRGGSSTCGFGTVGSGSPANASTRRGGLGDSDDKGSGDVIVAAGFSESTGPDCVTTVERGGLVDSRPAGAAHAPMSDTRTTVAITRRRGTCEPVRVASTLDADTRVSDELEPDLKLGKLDSRFAGMRSMRGLSGVELLGNNPCLSKGPERSCR